MGERVVFVPPANIGLTLGELALMSKTLDLGGLFPQQSKNRHWLAVWVMKK